MEAVAAVVAVAAAAVRRGGGGRGGRSGPGWPSPPRANHAVWAASRGRAGGSRARADGLLRPRCPDRSGLAMRSDADACRRRAGAHRRGGERENAARDRRGASARTGIAVGVMELGRPPRGVLSVLPPSRGMLLARLRSVTPFTSAP